MPWEHSLHAPTAQKEVPGHGGDRSELPRLLRPIPGEFYTMQRGLVTVRDDNSGRRALRTTTKASGPRCRVMRPRYSRCRRGKHNVNAATCLDWHAVEQAYLLCPLVQGRATLHTRRHPKGVRLK
jgi:hypothetical protein